MKDETFSFTVTVNVPGPTHAEDVAAVERFRQAWPPGRLNGAGLDHGQDVITYVRALAEGLSLLQGWERDRVRWASSVAFLHGLTAVTWRGEVLSHAGTLLLEQERGAEQ